MNNKINEIKYIGFYELNGSNSNRVCSIAATNKMNYICSAINCAGFPVNIISPSWIGNKSKIKWEKQKEVKINESTKVTFCPSFKSYGKFTLSLKIIISLIWLFLYLIFYTKKNEKVIAYHVPWISLPIRLAKFFKQFKLFLEVEEVYSDVMVVNSIFTRWEKKLLNVADTYLFSTDLLRDRLETKKPSLIIYGVYDVKEQLSEPIYDGKIHLVYAGIIDSNKKGAFNALAASQYLPNKYKLHIIGFGEIEKLCSLIKELNSTNDCEVLYNGTLYDSEYIKYCQSCHIGLSTQIMEGDYLVSSFPSKILSYLSMGLHVVSCKIPCVEKSSIGDLVNFYCDDSPRNIAEAIMAVDLTKPFDSRKILKELNEDFIRNIQMLLKGDKI